MHIKSLKLQNIRSYVEETIEFPEGSVLLSGDIGAGKSTILLAIEYALFGTKRGELEPVSLLRYGSHAGKIELVFDIQGKNVKISRTLRRTPIAIKQEAGYIVIDNKRSDATPVELRARVMELLGYPQEPQLAKDLIYRYTVFTPQEQMRQIIYENKENRLNTLRKIFNIDKYKRITENALFVAKELRVKKRALAEAVTDCTALEQQQGFLQEQLKEKEGQYSQHFLQLQQLQEKKAAAKKQVESAEAQQRKVHELRQLHALQMQELKSITAQQSALGLKKQHIQQQKGLLESMQKAIPQKPTDRLQHEIESEKESAEKHIQEMQQAQAIHAEQKRAAEEKCQQLQQEIHLLLQALSAKAGHEQDVQQLDACISHKQHIHKHIEDASQQLEKCYGIKASAELRKNTAHVTIENIQSMDVCTLCLQPIDDEHKTKIISGQTKQMQNAEHEIVQILSQEQIFRKQLDELKKQLQAVLAAEQKKASVISLLANFAEKEKELQQKQETYTALSQQIANLKPVDAGLIAEKQKTVVQLKLLLERLSAWESAILEQKNRHLMIQDKESQQREIETEIQHLEEKQRKIQQHLPLIQEELLQLKDAEIFLVQYKQEFQKILEHEKQCEIILATLQKEQQHIAQQYETLHAEIENRKAIQEKIRKMNAVEQWVEGYFVPLVQTMEKHVLLQVHSSFNQFFAQWFTTLMGDAMTAQLDGDFTPIIEQNEYDVDVVHLSGGEKTAVSLAYRLALNKVVNDFISTIATKDFIILDEPTEGFSSEQLDTVREVLDALGLKQIILVSHEQKIESFVEHVIRIEKHGYVSRVV